MLSPKVRAVFIKELRDSLRDRRTIFASVVIPVLLYPIMLLLSAEVSQIAKAKLEREVHVVAVPKGTLEFFVSLNALPKDEDEKKPDVKPDAEAMKAAMPASPLAPKSDAMPQPTLIFKEYTEADADTALGAGEIRASVLLAADFKELIGSEKQAKLEVRYDQAEQRSRDAAERVRNLLERYERSIVKDRLARNNLDLATLHPLKVTTTNVAKAAKVGGSVLGSFLPLLFIMMLITGAIHPAIDMTAGEKERSTLETLISTPVRPIEIITGKFLAVATMALGNAALNVFSFALTISMMPLPKSANFSFPWEALPLTLLLLIPLALFFSGLLLAVSSLAANQKEAQIYCLPIYLVPVIGMMVVSMPGIELEGPLLLAPVANVALLIKELFLSHGTAQQITFVFFSTCLYAAGSVAFAGRVFAREEVLFSEQASLRLFLSRKFFKAGGIPKAGDALLVAALLFPLNFYFQLGLQKVLMSADGFNASNFSLMVLLPLWCLFMALPIAVAWYLKLDLKKTFLWNAPTARAVLGAVCLGMGSWLVAQQLLAFQTHFWQFSAGEMEALERPMRELSNSYSGCALLIFLIGVTPGICEEHFFRGFLQQGLLKSGKWAALIAVGVIFGAYHFPLFRQPIVMLMGVVLAWVAYETRSMWPGVIYHTLHNSLGMTGPGLLKWKPEVTPPGEPMANVPLQYLIPALLLFGLGLLLVRGARRDGAEPNGKETANQAHPGKMEPPVLTGVGV
ncbi:MAG TPA: ABC transporter permease subunit/CPBP intramembrane protease [Planctomycetota bacterium]|nr:ABC transporter permease subunit/CPBP intramembrane protease [Planctomycetota bacterium]